LSIAFRITATRIYPTIKYALGYGQTCQRVTVAGKGVTPGADLKLTSQQSMQMPMHARAG
jgi:hypothetical protein